MGHSRSRVWGAPTWPRWRGLRHVTSQVLFQLPRFQGDFRTMALETILSQIDTDFAKETAVQAAQELFIALHSKDLAGMLRHRYVAHASRRPRRGPR